MGLSLIALGNAQNTPNNIGKNNSLIQLRIIYRMKSFGALKIKFVPPSPESGMSKFSRVGTAHRQEMKQLDVDVSPPAFFHTITHIITS